MPYGNNNNQTNYAAFCKGTKNFSNCLVECNIYGVLFDSSLVCFQLFILHKFDSNINIICNFTFYFKKIPDSDFY